MSTTRESFVARFGEEQAKALEEAADYHASTDGTGDRGSDPFIWVLIVCIGSECLGRYAPYHRITVPEAEAKAWCVATGAIAYYDGDVDALSLLSGAYIDWMPAYLPEKEEA